MLLDRGAVDRGEAILREVIVEAEHESDEVALVQGLVCLGDLLYELDRKSEARSYLERALKNRRDDDVLAYEFARAAELLIRPE
ncbi:hypothetical protein GQ57_39115 [Burkholderia sp. MSh2]|nr:hypothetical protein GQ57_39115 [Burkholderia sp. MSh2]